MASQLARDALKAGAPRIYGVAPGWKLFLVLFGVLFGLGGVAGLAFAVFVPGSGNEPIATALFLGAIAAVFAAFGVYCVLSALMYRVLLTADGVEVLEPFQRRRLLWAQMRGRRLLRNKYGPATVVLVPRAESARKLNISGALKTDRAFDAWIAQLPDLDREDRERSEQEVAAALHQDLLPQDWQARLKRLKRLADCVNGATIALCVVAFALPDYRHSVTATLIALPWVAIWLVSRFQPMYRFGTERNDAHPNLTTALILPGLLLALRVLTDTHTFDWSGPLMLAIGGGLALCGAALQVDPWFRQQRWTAILACGVLLAYGFGAGLEIDVFADSTKPRIYSTQVLAKRVDRGSRSNTYYLRVAAWGPFTGGQEIGVDAGRYDATRTGDTVCIHVGKGALRVPWYQVRDCPTSSNGPVARLGSEVQHDLRLVRRDLTGAQDGPDRAPPPAPRIGEMRS